MKCKLHANQYLLFSANIRVLPTTVLLVAKTNKQNDVIIFTQIIIKMIFCWWDLGYETFSKMRSIWQIKDKVCGRGVCAQGKQFTPQLRCPGTGPHGTGHQASSQWCASVSGHKQEHCNDYPVPGLLLGLTTMVLLGTSCEALQHWEGPPNFPWIRK
jgi:hypothetical protein